MVTAWFLLAIIAILLLVRSAAFIRQVQNARGLPRRGWRRSNHNPLRDWLGDYKLRRSLRYTNRW